jgi:hypothetical protein
VRGNGHAGPALEPDLVPPPFERGQHGDPIVRREKTIADSDGRIGHPWVAVGLLLRLHDRGRISDDELAAGYRFRTDFDRGHLDQLRVPDLARVRVDITRLRRELPTRVCDAQERVLDAVNALGGLSSPAGSCCWHVVGEDVPLRTWVLTRYTIRRITENQAPGVLFAALGCLTAYYSRGKQ